MGHKLLKMIDYLWTMEPAYKVNNPPKRLEEIKRALMSSTFRFSSMYRSWIPKPNKPGKMRPITQPHKEDFIVMDAL